MSATVRMMVATHMNAQVRKTGARKAIDISLRIDVPADIVVASTDEAPAVLHTKHVEKGAAVARQYRGFDGRLFEPVVDQTGRAVDQDRFQKFLGLEQEASTWRSPFATSEEVLVSPNAKKPVATKTLPHERDAGFKEVVKDDRVRRMAEVARAASAFLVVDGVVHRECMAPRWVIRETDKRKLSMVAETSPTWPSMDSFSIDRPAEAYAYLAMKSKHLRAPPRSSSAPRRSIRPASPSAMRSRCPAARSKARWRPPAATSPRSPPPTAALSPSRPRPSSAPFPARPSTRGSRPATSPRLSSRSTTSPLASCSPRPTSSTTSCARWI